MDEFVPLSVRDGSDLVQRLWAAGASYEDCAAVRRLERLVAEWVPEEPCVLRPFSSAACSRGTKGCEEHHGRSVAG